MHSKTSGNQGPRRAGAPAAVAAVAVLATACGTSAATPDSFALGGPVTVAQEAALTQCMRSHGVPGFPELSRNGQATPASSGNADVSPTSPRFQAAMSACHHVLPAGVHISVQKDASASTKGS